MLRIFLVICTSHLLSLSYAYSQAPAFPSAEGFGAYASGGRGGKVIYVTNLNISGSGSLQEALNESGKRYILFKVSGVINGTVEVPPGHGDFTLAGHTSPNGIIVRGFQSYNDENRSSGNFIVRHLRSRIGTTTLLPTSNWIGADGLTLGGVHNAIIDHCSFGQANDEAVDISRSSGLTIQNCMLSETLGEHAYLGGMLINYSSSQSRLDSISIHHNLWNRIGGRMPEISCESPFCNGKSLDIELSNNLFYDQRIELWYEGNTGSGNFFLNLNAVNNFSQVQSSYNNGMFHHDLLHFSKNQLYFSGNRLSKYSTFKDFDLFYCCNDFNTNFPNTDFGKAQRLNQRHNFPVIAYHNSEQLRDYAFTNVGAFPRDKMDTRLMVNIGNNTFDPSPIDDDKYKDAFLLQGNQQPTLDTDSDGMPDYWEDHHGLNKNIQDHNGNSLSTKIYNSPTYTNLECYLNCLSDAIVGQDYNAVCGIRLNTTTAIEEVESTTKVLAKIFPNPSSDYFTIQLIQADKGTMIVYDAMGKIVMESSLSKGDNFLSTPLSSGIYFVKITAESFKTESHTFIVNH